MMHADIDDVQAAVLKELRTPQTAVVATADELFERQTLPPLDASLFDSSPSSLLSDIHNFTDTAVEQTESYQDWISLEPEAHFVSTLAMGPTASDSWITADRQTAAEKKSGSTVSRFGYANGIDTTRSEALSEKAALDAVYTCDDPIALKENRPSRYKIVDVWNAANGLASSRRGVALEPSVMEMANAIERDMRDPKIRCTYVGYSQGAINILNALETLQRKHGNDYFARQNRGRVYVVFFATGINAVPDGVNGVVYRRKGDWVAKTTVPLTRLAIWSKQKVYGNDREYRKLPVVLMEGDTHTLKSHLDDHPEAILTRFTSRGRVNGTALADFLHTSMIGGKLFSPRCCAEITQRALSSNGKQRFARQMLRHIEKDSDGNGGRIGDYRLTQSCIDRLQEIANNR